MEFNFITSSPYSYKNNVNYGIDFKGNEAYIVPQESLNGYVYDVFRDIDKIVSEFFCK